MDHEKEQQNIRILEQTNWHLWSFISTAKGENAAKLTSEKQKAYNTSSYKQNKVFKNKSTKLLVMEEKINSI